MTVVQGRARCMVYDVKRNSANRNAASLRAPGMLSGEDP